MNFQDILEHLSSLPQEESQRLFPFVLNTDILQYIYENIDETSKTLETGAGLSTVIFALRGANHICVVPSKEEVDHVIEYCAQCKIPTQKINFYIERSENVIPALKFNGLDLVLIDGRHAFPTPFIDWYYTCDALKIGGKVIIDDTNVWTGRILKDFLLLEPEWKLIKDVPQRAAAFMKLKEGSHSKEFHLQPFVMLNSDIKTTHIDKKYIKIGRAIKLLCTGRFLTLARKIMHRLKLYYHFGIWK
ncbi:MAG: class I SAM-dependent methyltransferase [Candidatus Omnitrophica bacterium]|nr:class I SAM-dependent methyltransferase [Candidatus Omnitrophota bacterium]